MAIDEQMTRNALPGPGFDVHTVAMPDAKASFISDIYQRYHDLLQRYLSSRLRSTQEAEDVAHDAYLRLHAMEAPQLLEHPQSFLFRTAANLVTDRLRARTVRANYLRSIPTTAEAERCEHTPEALADARQRLRVLNQAVADLPPRCRRVFVLHKFHHFSHAQISAQLGITRHAVEKHIVRALARCQAHMDSELGDGEQQPGEAPSLRLVSGSGAE